MSDNAPVKHTPLPPPRVPTPNPHLHPHAHQAPAPRRPAARQGERDWFGRTIGGKYIIRSVLGEGGMGTVFEAEHAAIGRSVAIKVLHPQQARRNVAVTRLYQEARAAGAIGHPNICEVYDPGDPEAGSPYLVMERLVGETLADRIARQGGLGFIEVVDILMQVLSGLVVAHEKGIVHRDIKPENVFLARAVGFPMTAKILDFGISKMVTGDENDELHLTRTGMVMGTPFYMSPEQARGDRDLDARVDLYACGVILYEALTGRRPFVAPNYNALLMQILTGAPRPMHEIRKDVPAELERITDRAMRRSRDERYPSALEFHEDLLRLIGRSRAVASMELAELPPRPLPPEPRPNTGRHARVAQGSGSVPRFSRASDLPPSLPMPSSIEIPVDFDPSQSYEREHEGSIAADEFDDFDNMPTEIHSPLASAPPPRKAVPFSDDDEAAETVVRQEAVELLRSARTGSSLAKAPSSSQSSPPPHSSQSSPPSAPFDPDDTSLSREIVTERFNRQHHGKPRR